MADAIADTSVIQYLHQLGLLDVLPKLSPSVLTPTAVVAELEAGRAQGVALPDPQVLPWLQVISPKHPAKLPRVRTLGPGEAEVITLALERANSVALLDDKTARAVAQALGLHVVGTLGVLLQAKRAGLIPTVRDRLQQLDSLGFRLAPSTREAVLTMAGES